MARKMSTTPRSDVPVEHGSILDLYEPGGGTGGKPEQKTQEGPSVAELMERLGEINARLDASDRERDMSDNMRQAPTVPQVAAEAPKLNLEGLPDPLTDSQGYARELANRTVQYQSAIGDYARRQSQPQVAGDLDALWEDFQDTHPDYTGDSNKIKFATERVVDRLKKRGVDVQRFMFSKSERFFDMMTEEYDATFGNPLDEDYEDEPEERPAPRKRSRARDDDSDGDDGRTDGIMGGGDAPGQRQGPRQPNTGLIEDLQAIQRKTGYY